MDPETAAAATTFADLALPEPLLHALRDVGYTAPSPIQVETIPHLLAGRDLFGQAQTGTGKTAAFALPILAQLELAPRRLQALVLTPTRELGIQVAESFQRYAAHLPGFRVVAIYGGQSYGPQLAALDRGVHVVVGTPGRLLDHIGRGTIDLSQLRFVVLDEADEMLRMGFIDDVESILAETPATRQSALFSATLPAPIRRIAKTHLHDPVTVTIAAATKTAETIRQRYWEVSGLNKLDALCRILEAETYDGIIVFARTKRATDEIAEALRGRGFAAAAMSGDLTQAQRERTIADLKDGHVDILVATDVAARGLDVDRISHVINFDAPADPESYVHRIGRTGRAGRSGEAILFVSPRERHILRAIERATRQPIEVMGLPTVRAVNDARIARFKGEVEAMLGSDAPDLLVFRGIIEELAAASEVPVIDVAAALAKLYRGDEPLLLERPPRAERRAGEGSFGRPERPSRDRNERGGGDRWERRERPPREPREREIGGAMAMYRVEVGHAHRVRPGNLVGAIANEAGLSSSEIGRIEIRDNHSLIELPEGMPTGVLRHLQKVWCGGQQLQISALGGGSGGGDDDEGGRRERPRRG